MKKILLITALLLISNFAQAHEDCAYETCSPPDFLVNSEHLREEQNFPNCKEHIKVTDTYIDVYSRSGQSTYVRYTAKRKDGSVIIDRCRKIEHAIHNGNHYFIVNKNKKCGIIKSNGEYVTSKNYSYLEEIEPNRVFACINKKCGVIDFNEKVIVPIKYKKFEKVGKDIYITKLNGYYGMMNSSNVTFIKNQYDKITPLNNTFLIKSNWKYGLADSNAKIILEPIYDKISALDEYIIVKLNKQYQVYDSNGKLISDKYYSKVSLKKNVLKGKPAENEWVDVL